MSIGNFDGVHRGHGALLEALRSSARSVAGPAVVVTFDPHPLQLLRPEKFQPVLTTIEHRAELLARSADRVLILRTTRELLHLSAEEFFQRVVLDQLGARTLVEGMNFGFGRNREGNVETLQRLCHEAGLNMDIVTPLTTTDSIPISSSRVRNALLEGDVRDAASFLGRQHRLRGKVVEGQRRGQTLGFPTANLENISTLVPKDGVYSVQVLLGETVWSGAANIGPNPTFGERTRKVEVHLIDFHDDLYGRELDVDFIERLRDTRSFSGPEQLVEQLKRDIEQARQLTHS